jgi:hypothetical protein
MSNTLSKELREWATGPMCRNPEHQDACNMLLRAADELDRLREMIEQTADGVLLPDTDRLFCPKCTGEVRQEHVNAYCDSCVNPDGYDQPPLPLFYSMCFSTREAAQNSRNSS